MRPDWPLPALCVRSDVERKRLLGVDACEDATARGAPIRLI